MYNSEFLEESGKSAGKCFLSLYKSVESLIRRCCFLKN